MSRAEIRAKLKAVIKDTLLSSLEEGKPIPNSLSQYVLETNGWSSESQLECEEDLNDFLDLLKQRIEKAYFLSSRFEKPIAVDYNLNEVFQEYIKSENEYCQVSIELIEALEKAISEKEKFSKLFENECMNQYLNMKTFAIKAKFLELQLFLKLYGEKHALYGHLALKAKMEKELEELKKKYKKTLELNEEYSKIKDDKNFCELFKKYKELVKIKERTEIIEQL